MSGRKNFVAVIDEDATLLQSFGLPSILDEDNADGEAHLELEP